MVTDINQLDPAAYYTYADYLTWKFSERVELLRGKLLRMSAAPSTRHQDVATALTGIIWQHLRKSKSCKVYSAPFDVRLPVSLKEGKTDTVVQPDITVVCNLEILDLQGCNGAPDLVVEVLSPGNTKREMRDKLELYREAKVKEYWLIDPVSDWLIIYRLDKKGAYVGSTFYTEDSIVSSSVLPNLEIDLQEIFNND